MHSSISASFAASFTRVAFRTAGTPPLVSCAKIEARDYFLGLQDAADRLAARA